jgi:hypothetical protein
MGMDRGCDSEASPDLEMQVFLFGYRDVVMGTTIFLTWPIQITISQEFTLAMENQTNTVSQKFMSIVIHFARMKISAKCYA